MHQAGLDQGAGAGYFSAPPAVGVYEVVLRDERGQAGHARVTRGRVRPEALGDAGWVRPMAEAAARQPGYAGFALLADRAGREVLGLSYWASEAALGASEGGYYSAGMAQRASAFEGQPARAVYEVAAQG